MKKLPKRRLGMRELEALIILLEYKGKPLRNKQLADIMEETEQNSWNRLRRLWHSRLVMKNPEDKTYTITSRGLNAIVERIFNV